MTQNGYWKTLCDRFGGSWTRFWFTPSDPVVLSLLRILVGLVALWWLLSFLPVLQEWFGPQGLFPQTLTNELRKDAAGEPTFAISVLDWVNSASQLWLVYWLGILAMGLMIAGVLSRFTTIAALVFVLSFIHRGLMFTRPVDDILAFMMFYLCIGPSGASFSVDAWLRQRRRQQETEKLNLLATTAEPIQYSSAATVAVRLMQVHLALVYGAMFVGQLEGEAWWQGTAVWWMMARPDSRLVDLTFLSGMGNLAFEYFINFCTHAILLYEICFALLIWHPLARPILLALGVVVWIGMALVSGWVSFAILMLIANLAFLSPETLRRWTVRDTTVSSANQLVAAA